MISDTTPHFSLVVNLLGSAVSLDKPQGRGCAAEVAIALFGHHVDHTLVMGGAVVFEAVAAAQSTVVLFHDDFSSDRIGVDASSSLADGQVFALRRGDTWVGGSTVTEISVAASSPDYLVSPALHEIGMQGDDVYVFSLFCSAPPVQLSNWLPANYAGARPRDQDCHGWSVCWLDAWGGRRSRLCRGFRRNDFIRHRRRNR